MQQENDIQNITSAVNVIKTAILQSQSRAAKAVNQEMLALYYGIGRFISANTRNRNWGKGMLAQISERLRSELPGLRGFGESSLKNMRLFYEAWSSIERNSPIAIGELVDKSAIAIAEAKGLTPGNLYYCKRFYLLYNQLFEKVPQVGEIIRHNLKAEPQNGDLQIVPQVGEIFKPLHTIAEKGLLPLNIFAIPWGHHHYQASRNWRQR